MKSSSCDGWFLALQGIVEERIRQAQRDGLFDDLPGQGKPLQLDDDSLVAPALRASYRILKNAGILPQEMQLRREISNLKQLLGQVQDEGEAKEMVREINRKVLESNIMGGFSIGGGMDQLYVEKVMEKIRLNRQQVKVPRAQEERKPNRSRENAGRR